MMPDTRRALDILEEWIKEEHAPGVDDQDPVRLERLANLLENYGIVETAAPCVSPNGRTDCHMRLIEMIRDEHGDLVRDTNGLGRMRCSFCKEEEPAEAQEKRRVYQHPLKMGL